MGNQPKSRPGSPWVACPQPAMEVRMAGWLVTFCLPDHEHGNPRPAPPVTSSAWRRRAWTTGASPGAGSPKGHGRFLLHSSCRALGPGSCLLAQTVAKALPYLQEWAGVWVVQRGAGTGSWGPLSGLWYSTLELLGRRGAGGWFLGSGSG